MAAFTSKAAGNWSASGQTTWNEVGVPGNGDTVSIAHAITVDVNTTVGDSPAEGTAVITITVGGSLTVAAGVTFTVRGDTLLNNGGVTLNPGAIWEFDASLATDPTNQNYSVKLFTNYQVNNKFRSGDSTDVDTTECHVRSNASGGNGWFSLNGQLGFQFECYHTTFLRIGDATNGINVSTFNANNPRVIFSNCTFDACGELKTTDAAAADGAQIMKFLDCVWQNSVGTDSLDVGVINAKHATAVREIKRCYFDKSFGDGGTGLNVNGFTIEDNIMAGDCKMANAVSPSASWARNVMIMASDSTSTASDVTDCFLYTSGSTESNPRGFSIAGTRDFTISGLVIQGKNAASQGDVFTPGTTGTNTVTFRNNLLLPKAGGTTSGQTFITVGSVDSPAMRIENNTICADAPGGSGFQYAETAMMTTGKVVTYMNNIVWNSAAQNSNHFLPLTLSPPDDLVAANICTNNCAYNLGLTSALTGRPVPAVGAWADKTSYSTYYMIPTTVGTPGAGDVNVDPMFVDTTRNFETAGAQLWGADGSVAGTLAALAVDQAVRIPMMLNWIKAGFAPTNSLLRGAGTSGGDIGAVSVNLGQNNRVNTGIRIGV